MKNKTNKQTNGLLDTTRTGLGMILVLFVLIGALVGLPWLTPGRSPVPAEIQMGMIIVLAVGVLISLLYFMVAGLSSLDLANPKEAIGLPEGSIRAFIALFFIMIFIIVSIYLFRTVVGDTGATLEDLTSAQVIELGEQVVNIQQNQEGTFDVTLRAGISEAGERLALQLITTLGTLVAAISAFYFGYRVGEVREQSETVALTIDSIEPASGYNNARLDFVTLTGTGFVNGAQVVLNQQGTESDIVASGVKVSEDGNKIVCSLDLTDKPTGKWNVVVINPGEIPAVKAGAFEVKAPPEEVSSQTKVANPTPTHTVEEAVTNPAQATTASTTTV